MPITTKSGKPGGYVVLRATGTDGFKLNHATLPAANSAGETVSEMRISEIMWSVAASQRWTVKRGANTMVELAGNGHHDYQANGIKLEVSQGDLTANLNCTLSGGTGTIIVKMHKASGE